MDQDRLNEITEYYRQNPTPPAQFSPGSGGEQHIHVHYHQAPYSTEPVEQNKGQSVLEKYTPYFMVFLGGFIIVVGGTVVLMFVFTAIAMVLLVLLGCIAGLIVLAAVVAILLKSYGESGALRNLSEAAKRRRYDR